MAAAKFFVETEQGDLVNDDRLDEIRKHARKFWDEIDKASAPPTWKHAPTEMKQMYQRFMVDKFPELRLCDNSWKADQIAASNYGSWYNYWVKRRINDAQMKPAKRQKTTLSVSMISNALSLLFLISIPY